MAKHKKAKDNAWMDDHDDAHFSGNPAYREKKSTGKGKRRVKGHSHSSSFNTVYGKSQTAPKKTSKKKVFVKQ
jgi:hypothetical protein